MGTTTMAALGVWSGAIGLIIFLMAIDLFLFERQYFDLFLDPESGSEKKKKAREEAQRICHNKRMAILTVMFVWLFGAAMNVFRVEPCMKNAIAMAIAVIGIVMTFLMMKRK